jgi:hypothetical protein
MVWFMAYVVIVAPTLGLLLQTVEQNFCLVGHTKM